MNNAKTTFLKGFRTLITVGIFSFLIISPVGVSAQSLAPTVSISANPASVQSGSSSTITWNSQDVNYCVPTGGTNGWVTGSNRPAQGSFPTGALTETTTYNITCYAGNGQSASSSTTVTVSGNSIPTWCANGSSLTSAEFKNALDAGVISASVNYSGSTGTFNITNNTGCTAPLSLSSYKMYDWVLSNQTLLDRTNLTTMGSGTLSVAIASCKTQVDAWYGFAPATLLDSNPYSYPNNPWVIKWLQTSSPFCTNVTTQPDLIAAAPTAPANILVNANVVFTAGISNIGNASATYFANLFQTATGANGSGTVSEIPFSSIYSIVNSLTAGGSTNVNSTPNTTSFSSAGTYSVRTCADHPANSIIESNENNNCSPWTNFTVSNPVVLVPSGNLYISPSSCVINAGASTCTVTGATWNTQNVTSPSVVDRNTGTTLSTLANNSNPMQVWVAYPSTTFDLKNAGSILDTKVATASCATGTTWNGNYCLTNVVVQNPTVNISANPSNIPYGVSTNISWDSTNANSCTATGGANNWAGSKIPDGNFPSGQLFATTVYTITCYGATGTTPATDSVTVTVNSQIQNPTVTLTANPMNISYNGTTTVAWNSTNATSCSATGGNVGWAGSKSLGGSFFSGSLTQTTTYNIICYGATGTTPASASVTVTVGAQVLNPAVQLTANPTSILFGGSSTLSWTSQNASFCSPSWGSNVGTSGTRVVNPTSTTTYTITCFGASGTTPATDQATVNVGSQPIPSGDLTVSPASCIISAGQATCTTGATWTTNNVTSATLVDRNTGATLASAINRSTPLTVWIAFPSTTFDLKNNGTTILDTEVAYASCASGTSWNGNSCMTNAVNPSVDLTADQTSVSFNGTTTLRWTSTNATSCTGSGGTNGWAGFKNIGADRTFFTGNLTNTTTYTITCTSATGQSVTDSVTVVVAGQIQYPTVQLTANPTSIQFGSSSTLSWTSQNAISCASTNFNTGNATAGNRTVSPTTTTTYSISCTSATGQTANDSVVVSVGNQVFPSGNLNVSPSSCLISAGQATCTTGATWTTNNVTDPRLVDRNTGATLNTAANRSTPLTVWVAYPYTTFDLKNGSTILDTQVATASCAAGTTWNGSACFTNQVANPTVNLSANPTSILFGGSSVLSWFTNSSANYCSANWTTSTATTGSKTVTPANTTTYSITCYGAAGTTPATDQVTINVGSQPIPSGNLIINPSSCVINAGQGTCTVTGATWNTSNVTAPLVVDRNTGATISTLANNSNPMQVWVAYPSTTFDLKNGSSVLDTKIATASCVAGTTWNGSTCLTNQVATPTVSLTANPSSIQSGNSSSLVWTSTNATSCYAPWTSSSANAGSQTVSPTMTTTYSITCINSTGQQATANATVSVNQQTQSPTVNLYADNNNVNSGNSTTLRWSSTNANSCYGSNFSTNNSTSGNTQTASLYNTTTYNITCTNSSGQQAQASTTVYVNTNVQTCQDPSALNYRGPLPCTYYQPILVCQDPGAINYRGTLPCVYQPINNQPTVGVSADSTNLAYNGTTNIRWFTSNATSCFASGGSVGWAGTKSIGPASFYTGSLTGTRTYTLTCTNNFGSSTDSVTVNVRGRVINPINPVPPTSLVLITSTVDRNQPIVPTIDNTRPHPGDQINYTVSYQNIGNASITGLTLRIDLPYEVDYMFSNPSNPTRNGNTLIFNLGTLRANGQGTVTVRVRVRDDIAAGTNLNFPAVLSYIDPSGYPQSVTANVSAQVWTEPVVVAPIAPTDVNNNIDLGANVFGAGFLPANLFGWLLLLILLLILLLLAKYLFGSKEERKETTTTVVH